jgi:hypothetical protein
LPDLNLAVASGTSQTTACWLRTLLVAALRHESEALAGANVFAGSGALTE